MAKTLHRLAVVASVACAVAAIPLHVRADEFGGDAGRYARASFGKLLHALVSIPYGFVDVVSTPAAMASQLDRDGRAPLGLVMGVPVGLVNGALRQGVAGWDVLTFAFVDPDSPPRTLQLAPYMTGWDAFDPRDDPGATALALRD